MRNFILGALLLLSMVSFGQGLEPLKNGVGVGTNFSSKSNSIAIEITSLKTNSPLWGAGVSKSINAPSYRGGQFINKYDWNNIDEIKSGETYAFYGLGGYTFKNIKAYGKIGVGFTETVGYYNSYNYEILGEKAEPLFGVGIGFGLKSVLYDVAFDTYHGFTLGFGVIF